MANDTSDLKNELIDVLAIAAMYNDKGYMWSVLWAKSEWTLWFPSSSRQSFLARLHEMIWVIFHALRATRDIRWR
jgi:hypothetical protein